MPIDVNVEGWNAVFAKIDSEGGYEETFINYGLTVNDEKLTAAIKELQTAVDKIDDVLNNHGWNNGDWETGNDE